MFLPYRRTVADSRGDALFSVTGEVTGEEVQLAPAQVGLQEEAPALGVHEETMGILGHELRNPLSAIVALARGTMRREDIPDEVRERLAQVDRAAQRSLAMIDSLLDFSVGRWRGSLPIHRVLAEPSAVACAVVEEMRAAYPDRTVALEVRASSPFFLDPLRIGQVLSNLIGNALVHGHAHTPVQVMVDVRDGEAVLAVRNQGPTIPAERVASLFEPFTQAIEPRTKGLGLRPARGFGLGLYIVRVIVTAHGGSVEVESDADTGTTFVVRLPERAAQT